MNEWISVKDRMPPVGVEVLVWDIEGFGFIDRWTERGMWGIAWSNEEVTHWMPLPEPPESGDAE